MKRFLIPLFMLVLLVTGCFNENDATVVAIYADPSSTIVKSGDMVYIDTKVTTLNNSLTNVTVSSFDPEHGKIEIHNINPGAKTYQDRITWEIPSMTGDTTLVEVQISATDDKGTYNDHKLKLKAIGGNTALLPERSGITLYSPLSDKPDAFSFTTLQPLHSSSEAPDCDIVFLIPEETNETMPLVWGTKTDVVFCKANSLDYASATWSNLQVVFNSSLRHDTISDLQTDDTIIVGRETHTEDGDIILHTLGAIKIMAIYDEPGTLSDRIVFNLKTILK
jgi:hypothetical protein